LSKSGHYVSRDLENHIQEKIIKKFQNNFPNPLSSPNLTEQNKKLDENQPNPLKNKWHD
jgi:hypothetical protein